MSTEPLIYTVRPDRTALWLPWSLCEALGLTTGAVLTEEQFAHRDVQDLLMVRRSSERGSRTP